MELCNRDVYEKSLQKNSLSQLKKMIFKMLRCQVQKWWALQKMLICTRVKQNRIKLNYRKNQLFDSENDACPAKSLGTKKQFCCKHLIAHAKSMLKRNSKQFINRSFILGFIDGTPTSNYFKDPPVRRFHRYLKLKAFICIWKFAKNL